MEKGTIKWLKDMGIDIESVDWKETALPNGVLTKTNEPGALGIGKDLITTFNNRVKKVTIK